MTTPDSEHIRELLVPYSLHVLSEDEARTVRRALEQSAQLRDELREIEATAASLVTGAVELETAPAFIKARVLESIGAAERTSTSSLRRAQRRGRWQTLVPSVLAAGFAGACVVLAIFAVSLHSDLDDATKELDGARDRASAIPSDMSLQTVSTSGAMAPATGKLIRIASDRYVLLLNNVPNPGVGNSWQVWTADSKGGIANVGQWVNGSATQAILVSSSDIRQIMVSHEKTLRAVTRPSSAPMAEVSI